jgi:hypothetical protein
VATPAGQEVDVSICNSPVPAQSGAALFDAAGAAWPDPATPVFERIQAAGQRGVHGLAVSRALMAYWHALPRIDRQQRAALVAQVREAVRRGTTTARAWTCIALGDPDFEIVREATLGYLGTAPVSLERREQSVADVLDWIGRELPLNRAAAFTALVELNDAAVLEALAGVRGRLTDVEAAAVWAACAGTACLAVREFVAEWRSA